MGIGIWIGIETGDIGMTLGIDETGAAEVTETEVTAKTGIDDSRRWRYGG